MNQQERSKLIKTKIAALGDAYERCETGTCPRMGPHLCHRERGHSHIHGCEHGFCWGNEREWAEFKEAEK